MSRHKNIRNLDYSNELEYYDGAGEEDDDNEMSEVETQQMNHGLREVRKILGNDIPGLKDSQIEESLWYYYFDVSKTIDYLLNIHTKSKNQKKVGNITKAKSGAFAGPSPDDVVASAQQRGVSNNPAARTPVLLATEKLQDLNIAPLRPTHKIDVLKAHKESAEKENVNFVVVGHVDAGKSTLMGRLLCDSGVVDEKLLRKYKNEAEQMGKGSFALAWVLDQTQEERLRGVTIDTAVNKFETENSYFTILDAPGHRDFIPNMIAGAAQADFAVLVIDSSVGGFESGFNFKGQTKEHTLLVRSMGVQKIVVAVNKLDAVGWSRERFDEIKQQITQFLVNAGFSPKNMAFIPCSGLEGSNIVRKPEHSIMPWYKGPTLLEQLESSNKYARPVQKPLRLTVSDVLKGGGQISGRIDAGFLQEGDILLNIPSKDEVIVRTLFVDDIAKPWAVAGHNVLIHLGGTDLHLRPGDVLCNPNEPLIPLRSFNAKVLAFDSITPMIVDIHRGQLHTAGKVAVMLAILDRNTGEVLKKKPRHIPAGSLALIQIDLSGDVIPVEAGNKIVLRSNGQTVAAGIIEKHS